MVPRIRPTSVSCEKKIVRGVALNPSGKTRNDLHNELNLVLLQSVDRAYIVDDLLREMLDLSVICNYGTFRVKISSHICTVSAQPCKCGSSRDFIESDNQGTGELFDKLLDVMKSAVAILNEGLDYGDGRRDLI